MATIRAILNVDHLDKARELVAAGRGDGTIFADEKADGLILRVRKTGATFAVKWNGKTRAIGNLSASAKNPKKGEIPTISEARNLAGQVRALLIDGTDPTAFLTGKVAGKNNAAATVSAERATAVANGFWTWERLVDEYTDSYLGEPRLGKGNVIRQPSARSVATAKASLTVPEADFLKVKLLTEIEAGDFEKVRDDCKDAGRKTASRAFVSYSRAAMSFAKRKHKRMSGLGDIKPWWLGVEILDETAVASRTRMPTVEGLATTLYLAEKNRVIEGRRNRRATSETVLCGLWWLALTAQRTSAGLSLERDHVLPWKGGRDGWKVCLWSETVMKSRRYHALPIPPRVVLLLERAMSGSRAGSRYIFASTAMREGKDDRPISITSPKNLMGRLRGRPADISKKLDEKKEKEKPQRKATLDILGAAGVAHFSPHDIRRAFATTCADRTVRGDAISAVLDHAGIETGQKLVRSAEITRLAYDYSQRLELKAIAMEAWTNALFEAVESEWETNKPRRDPFARPVPPTPSSAKGKPGLAFSSSRPWYLVMEEAKAAERANRPKLQLGLLGRLPEWEPEPHPQDDIAPVED